MKDDRRPFEAFQSLPPKSDCITKIRADAHVQDVVSSNANEMFGFLTFSLIRQISWFTMGKVQIIQPWFRWWDSLLLLCFKYNHQVGDKNNRWKKHIFDYQWDTLSTYRVKFLTVGKVYCASRQTRKTSSKSTAVDLEAKLDLKLWSETNRGKYSLTR